MYLKIKTNHITDIEVLNNPVTEGLAVTILDKNGAILLNIADLSDLDPDEANNAQYDMQTDEGHAIEGCNQWLEDDALMLHIPFEFVHNSSTIGVRLVYNGITFYKSFTIFGIDLEIPMYILDSSISNNTTLATFVEIHSPISNMKMLYKTNNSKATSVHYIINDVTYSGVDVSFHARYDSKVTMTSRYTYWHNKQQITVTHSTGESDLYSYKFTPNVSIEKELIGVNILKKGDKFKLKAHIDFTNQVTYFVDGVGGTPIDRNYSIVFQVKDASQTLLAEHIELSYKSEQHNVVSFESSEITVVDDGKHTIELFYNNIGLNPYRAMVVYPVGTYMVMYTTGTNDVGEVIVLDSPTVKSSTLTLLPVITNPSNLEPFNYYYTPYGSGEVELGETIEEIVVGVSALQPILSEVFEDYIDVEDYVKVEQIEIEKFKVSNIYSNSLHLRVYKLEDGEWISNDSKSLVITSGEFEELVLSKGIYRLEIRDIEFEDYRDNPENLYIRNYIVISYAAILDAEMQFTRMLLNDCVGKDIDYRQFYDFTAFQFLLEIFYKIITTNQNFYYIYISPMGAEQLAQLYTAEKILNRLNDYVDEYTRKGTNIAN